MSHMMSPARTAPRSSLEYASSYPGLSQAKSFGIPIARSHRRTRSAKGFVMSDIDAAPKSARGLGPKDILDLIAEEVLLRIALQLLRDIGTQELFAQPEIDQPFVQNVEIFFEES